MENLIKLNLQEVLWIREDVEIYIEHQTKGSWWDVSDGVYSFMDLNDLHLKKTDTWLDCNEYGNTWTAYRKGAEQ